MSVAKVQLRREHLRLVYKIWLYIFWIWEPDTFLFLTKRIAQSFYTKPSSNKCAELWATVVILKAFPSLESHISHTKEQSHPTFGRAQRLIGLLLLWGSGYFFGQRLCCLEWVLQLAHELLGAWILSQNFPTATVSSLGVHSSPFSGKYLGLMPPSSCELSWLSFLGLLLSVVNLFFYLAKKGSDVWMAYLVFSYCRSL